MDIFKEIGDKIANDEGLRDGIEKAVGDVAKQAASKAGVELSDDDIKNAEDAALKFAQDNLGKTE